MTNREIAEDLRRWAMSGEVAIRSTDALIEMRDHLTLDDYSDYSEADTATVLMFALFVAEAIESEAEQ